jgi:hypothetical protein
MTKDWKAQRSLRIQNNVQELAAPQYKKMNFWNISIRLNLYSWPNIIRIIKSRRMRWARNVARMGRRRNAYRILVGKPEEKTPLERPRCGWVVKVKLFLCLTN